MTVLAPLKPWHDRLHRMWELRITVPAASARRRMPRCDSPELVIHLRVHCNVASREVVRDVVMNEHDFEWRVARTPVAAITRAPAFVEIAFDGRVGDDGRWRGQRAILDDRTLALCRSCLAEVVIAPEHPQRCKVVSCCADRSRPADLDVERVALVLNDRSPLVQQQRKAHMVGGHEVTVGVHGVAAGGAVPVAATERGVNHWTGRF